MKKIVFVLVFLFTISFQLNAQWSPQVSGTTEDLVSVTFIDSLQGFIVGTNGTIIKTTDGGINWLIKNSGTNYDLQSIQFINSNVGWIVGRFLGNYSSIVLKTTDGGENWNVLFQGGFGYMRSVCFIDSLIGWTACSSGARTLKTTDGGINWTRQDSLTFPGSISTYKDIYALNQNSIYVVGGFTPDIWIYPAPFGRIRYSGDGGINWTDVESYYWTIIYNAIEFRDSLTWWVVSDNGYILKTTDGGVNWEIHLSSNSIKDIKFIDQNNGWVVGSTGTIFTTTNGGTDWNSQATGTYNYLNSLYFINQHKGWVVGEGGTILHTSNGGISTVEVDINSPTKFSLEQNYPNPFNPSTKISWQSPVCSWQTLKVYDILGNEVTTLVNEYRNAGSYEVEFKSSVGSLQLASGVYYYQLKAGEYIETKKMILIK